MEVEVYNNSIVNELEALINEKNWIILFNIDNIALNRAVLAELGSRRMKNYKIWARDDIPEFHENVDRFLTSEEMNKILELFYLYDFSDKVRLITETKNQPTLLNFLNNGLLSENEVASILLGVKGCSTE